MNIRLQVERYVLRQCVSIAKKEDHEERTLILTQAVNDLYGGKATTEQMVKHALVIRKVQGEISLIPTAGIVDVILGLEPVFADIYRQAQGSLS